MSTTESMNIYQQLASVRLVANSNQTATYYNGPLNNGVGATLTYATGVLTIDSVIVNLNDQILFTGQTLGYQNGIYQCTVQGAVGVAAVLQRRGDFQCSEQVAKGKFVPVEAGTALAGSIWVVVEPLPGAIGVPTVVNANNINFDSSSSASISGALLVTNNLSELANPTAQAASLTNLGIHSAKFVNAGGSATATITDARIAAANVVVANIQSSANAVNIQKVTPGAGSLVILMSADPGASVISYIATSAVE